MSAKRALLDFAWLFFLTLFFLYVFTWADVSARIIACVALARATLSLKGET